MHLVAKRLNRTFSNGNQGVMKIKHGLKTDLRCFYLRFDGWNVFRANSLLVITPRSTSGIRTKQSPRRINKKNGIVLELASAVLGRLSYDVDIG
jgi:hypothetical protein